MADSVTYEEFVKQENRKSEMSPTDGCRKALDLEKFWTKKSGIVLKC